ncbi:hypothetical protein [Campylobacter concisus]|nr:hypothetical protein [Campylobacter concisus]
MANLLQKNPEDALYIISINKYYQSYEIDENSNIEQSILRCVI